MDDEIDESMLWMYEPTPYQRLPFVKRSLLWWRYMPIAYSMFVWRTVTWAWHGFKTFDAFDSRWETWDIIWSCEIGRAQIRMGHGHTLPAKKPYA